MLPLFQGPLPPPEPQEADVTRQLARRFARVVTLRHRQRHLFLTNGRQPRNCASRRRQDARARRHDDEVEAEAEPEPGDTSLDASIRSLQAHIASLERSVLLRDSTALLWRANRSAVAVDLTREYFLQFVRGYESSTGATTGRFVASVFRSDILCRDFQGLQPFMDQWEKYTTFHDGLTLRLNTVRLIDTDDAPQCAVTVYASGEMGLTFTQDTLKFLYPALFTQALQDSHEREIVDALVGSRGCLPLEIVFNFDQEGRVFAFETRVNLVATLLTVLHSPSAAIHVHQSSLMTTDGHWQGAHDPEEVARREQMLPRQLL